MACMFRETSENRKDMKILYKRKKRFLSLIRYFPEMFQRHGLRLFVRDCMYVPIQFNPVLNEIYF